MISRVQTSGLGDRAVRAGDLALRIVVIILMLAPVAVVVVLSFSNGDALVFPPSSWGTRYYKEFFGSGYWLSAVALSVFVSLAAAAAATVIGVPAVLAMARSRLRGRPLLLVLGIAPLLLPGVSYAIALYLLFSEWALIGTVPGVVIADMMVCLPFVMAIVSSGLTRVPRELELVAMSLGASRRRAVLGITIRLLRPSILAAFMLAFVYAFSEAVLINFLGDGSIVTLPMGILLSVMNGTNPIIAVIGTLLMAFTGLIMWATNGLRRR